MSLSRKEGKKFRPNRTAASPFRLGISRRRTGKEWYGLGATPSSVGRGPPGPPAGVRGQPDPGGDEHRSGRQIARDGLAQDPPAQHHPDQGSREEEGGEGADRVPLEEPQVDDKVEPRDQHALVTQG